MSSMELNQSEREKFLADLHVGFLCISRGTAAAPLTTPVWYSYEPGGEIRFSTNTDSRKLLALRKVNRANFTVHEENVPYKYVSVDGEVVAYELADPAEFHQWSLRYLGAEAGEHYYRAVEDGMPGMTTVRLRPQRWRTFDFAPMLG